MEKPLIGTPPRTTKYNFNSSRHQRPRDFFYREGVVLMILGLCSCSEVNNILRSLLALEQPLAKSEFHVDDATQSALRREDLRMRQVVLLLF